MNSKIAIPIMHCFDNNYVIPAAVSFYSMLEHANPDYYYSLYVLHTDITWQNQKKLADLVSTFPNASLEFINMSNRFNDLWKCFPATGHLTKELLYKLIAASIFPQYDKLIITDVDVIFLGDISQSYFSFSETDAVYLAGVRPMLPANSFIISYNKNYYRNFGENASSMLKTCGGYLVMNLRKIREDNMEDVFLDYLNKNFNKLFQPEQDVWNYCCPESKIVFLPLNYVVCSYAYDIFTTEKRCHTDANYKPNEVKNALLNPVQLHYATGTKPWNTMDSVMSDKWLLYLKKTEFYDDYLKKQSYCNLNTEYVPFWHPLSHEAKEVETSVDITVLCITYNHEKFIRDALEGIVQQIIDASIEVIISDDASTDGTQEIIREYRDNYPQIFNKCVLRSENVGAGKNCYEALRLVDGRYLAICDGDDMWIDPHKLQRQFDFMNDNPNYMICCTSLQKRRFDGANFDDEIIYINDNVESFYHKRDSYSFNDLLNCRYITASCTTMLRWHLRGNVPEWLQYCKAIDFALGLLHSAFGPIHVMNEHVTARYNVHSGGITSKSDYDGVSETNKIVLEVNQHLEFCLENSVREFMNSQKPSMYTKKSRIKSLLYQVVPPFIFLIYQKIKNNHKNRKEAL